MGGWTDGLEAAAREVLPDPVHRYYRQGAADEFTTGEAVAAWRRHRFHPHVLRDVSTVDLATTLLGTPVASPVNIAPTSLQRHAHPDGEIEMGRGARDAGALMCVSSNAGQTFADIAAECGPWWVQAYVLADRGLTREMLDRAVDAGAAAVVLTVDTPVVAAKREGDTSVWGVTPDIFLHANEGLEGVPHTATEKAADLRPADIGWLADHTGLPVVVKGVLRPDDARVVVDAGADAVWVSNHGGRQLDRSVSTAAALPGVAAAVSGEAEVYVDGGVRDGRDALVALALGARAVFLGRPPLFALATGAAPSVARLLDTVNSELREALTLVGVPSVDAVTRDLVSTP